MLGWLKSLLSWRRPREAAESVRVETPPESPRLQRIRLSEGVARTLFEDYQEHRHSPRGDEEIGWILLGLRQGNDAIAVAALPAGAERDAGAAHVRFNSEAQALASRIVRQQDKRLQIVAVVHTHPGSMRWPSDGDLHGDREWVAGLRSGEGVFAIGTADAASDEAESACVLVFGDLRFSWYTLAAGETRYRPLPIDVVAGSDLAMPLRPVWNAVEAFAEPLNRLSRQFAKVEFEYIDDDVGLLCVKIALAAPNQQIRLLLNDQEARYYWEREDELIAVDPCEAQLDRAVYLILAELAKDSIAVQSGTMVET